MIRALAFLGALAGWCSLAATAVAVLWALGAPHCSSPAADLIWVVCGWALCRSWTLIFGSPLL